MASQAAAVLLIALLLYKPIISFAFVPPPPSYYRRQTTTSPSNNTPNGVDSIILLLSCQSANQEDDQDHHDILITNDNNTAPQSAPSPVDFSTLRSIGVDYGLSRTGIAITTGGYNPRPLAILSSSSLSNNIDGLRSSLNNNNNTNTTQLVVLSTQIVHYLISEQATNIVLGLPLHKDGSPSEQSSITRQFAQVLLQTVYQHCGPRASITLWDERYTSKEARSRIQAEALARNVRIPSASELQESLDADAACIILEDYYKEKGVGGEVVVFVDDDDDDDEERSRMERECEEIYVRNMERQEEQRRSMVKERERGRNARQEMIARAKALELEEESGVNDDGTSGTIISGNKKKKKKKKKK